MKKLIVLMTLLFIISGCTLVKKNTPSSSVEEFFNKYISLNEDVIADLNSKVESENLEDDLKTKYKEIMKNAYSSLKYNIEEESIDGKNAIVKTRITVKDLYKVNNDVDNYYQNNKDNFMDNGLFNEYKYNSYLIEQMANSNDVIEYTLIFTLEKENDKWIINNLSEEDLEKINGIYNYDIG